MIKEQSKPTHMLSFPTNKSRYTIASLHSFFPFPSSPTISLSSLHTPSPSSWRVAILFLPRQSQALIDKILLLFTAHDLLHPPLPRSLGLFILVPHPLVLSILTVIFAIIVVAANFQIYAPENSLQLAPIGLRRQLPIFNPRDRVNRLLDLSLLRRAKRGVIAPFLAPTHFQNV